ncbi:MAG: hypothetical protein EPN94_06585 [Nitrospirae bacterium]|nr:MAG: hypothetical protein EPN94_06585 [Nitrospirota bacterium]
MASHKDKKELLALYKLFEGLEDTIIYTVGPEEDVPAKTPHIHADETDHKVKRAHVSLKKASQGGIR